MNEDKLREYIKANLDKIFFIKAGAGAGKTSIVVERIINQIKLGFAPESLVVITFTKKASQELKSRILEKTSRALNDYSSDSKEYANIKSALEKIDQMQISTIHSFCNVLLKEQMFASKLRKDAEILEDNDLDDYLNQFYNQNIFKVDYDGYRRFRENYDGRKSVVLDAFKSIVFISDDTKIMYRKELLNKELEYYDNRINGLKAKFDETVKKHISRLLLKPIELLDESDLSKFALMAPLTKEKDFDKSLAKAIETRKIFNSKKTKITDLDGFSAGIIDDIVLEVIEVERLVKERKDYQHALVMNVAVQLRNLFRNSFDSKYFSNDQLLQRALKLINDNYSAWKYYHDKFKCIYVDEFQDTDHTQASLIMKLCSKQFNGNELIGGKLVVVGDYKQSIYRFRGADLPEYFLVEDVVKKQGERGEVANLDYNFRSSPLVVDWVNDNFKCIEAYSDMIAKCYRIEKPASENIIEGVYTIGDELKSDRGGLTANQKEAIMIANFINNLVGKYSIYDKEIRSYRKIRYSDFMLLSKVTTKMKVYSDALIEAGIAVNVAGKIDVTLDKYLNKYAVIYNYLVHKHKDNNSEKNVRELVGINNFDTICNLKEQLKDNDGNYIAYYLLHHLEFILDNEVALNKEKINQLQIRLQQMVETVTGEYENDGLVLADEFYHYIQKPVEREMTLQADVNAIRYMNVHKSKGLEGRIVIICDRRSSTSLPSNHVHRNDEGFELYPVVTLSFNSALSGYNENDAIATEAKQAESEELVRLEYVAATRAMEALVIMPALGNDSFMAGYDYSKATHIDYDDELLKGKVTEEQAETKIYDSSIWNSSFDEHQFVSRYQDITPSSLELHEEVSYIDARPRGACFGTIMHRLFELIVLNRKDLNKNYLINKAILESYEKISEDYRDVNVTIKWFKNYLDRIYDKFLGSEVMSLVKKSINVYCEYPFFIKDDNKWIHGFSDLVIENKDEIIVVDYKSDSIGQDEDLVAFEERLYKQYSPQLELYKKSLEKSFGNKNIRTILYHLY